MKWCKDIPPVLEWERWWALFPVQVSRKVERAQSGERCAREHKCWVWLEWVERSPNFFSDGWRYRPVGTQQ